MQMPEAANNLRRIPAEAVLNSHYIRPEVHSADSTDRHWDPDIPPGDNRQSRSAEPGHNPERIRCQHFRNQDIRCYPLVHLPACLQSDCHIRKFHSCSDQPLRKLLHRMADKAELRKALQCLHNPHIQKHY